MLYALGAIAGALLNRIRGGWWLDWISLPADSAFRGVGVWVPALLIFYLFLDAAGWLGALVIALAYVGGESFGWTKWVHGVTGLRDPQNPNGGKMSQEVWNITQYRVDDTGHSNGIHWIASLIFKENENYWAYSMLAFTIRGLYWWGPVAGAMWYFGIVPPVKALTFAVVLAVMLPMVYLFASRVDIFGLRYLAKAELIYGALYGAALVYASLN